MCWSFFINIILFKIFLSISVFIIYFLNEYSGVIVSLSAILGVFFGHSWVDTSKKKITGKLDYDIARKYLKNILHLRDAIKEVRNPFISTSEIQKAFKKNDFNIEVNNEKINRNVYLLRWNKVQKIKTIFDEIITEAEVSWGEDALKIQKEIDNLIKQLRATVWLFINYPDNFNKKREENEKIIYGTYDSNDEFANKIDIEIEKVRNFLKKYL